MIAIDREPPAAIVQLQGRGNLRRELASLAKGSAKRSLYSRCIGHEVGAAQALRRPAQCAPGVRSRGSEEVVQPHGPDSGLHTGCMLIRH